MERIQHRRRATYEAGFHVLMLLDRSRVDAFRRAVKAVVRPGDVVVDAGTGSGVLALFAAEYGASRVFAVEVDPGMAACARRNVTMAGYGDVIDVVESDVLSFAPSEKVDVVLGEMLHTWLVEEIQMPAFEHLRSWLRPGGRMIPQLVENYLTIAQIPVFQPGFALSTPFHRWISEKSHRTLSAPTSTEAIDLGDSVSGQRVGHVALQAVAAGTADALILESRALLADDIWVGETPTLFPAIHVPVPPVEVAAGDMVRVDFSYLLGGRWDRLTFSARRQERA